MKKLDDSKKVYLNYSTSDGSNVDNLLKHKLLLKTKKVCNHCGIENKDGLYCKVCGESLDEINNIEKTKPLNNINVNIKPILLTSITSVGILFLISLGLKLLMSLGLGEFINFISPLQIILGVNLGTINLNVSSMMNTASVSIHLGILLFGLIPLFALLICNFIFIKNKNSKDVLYNSLGVGIAYGLILAIISIFSSSTTSSVSHMMNYGIVISYGYKILELFVNGFVLGFISTYLMGYKKKYFGENIYLDILKFAINSILILYAVIFVILLGISLVDNNYLYELGLYNYHRNTILIVSQLAAYILAFVNIVPITIGSNKLSLLSTINSSLSFDIKLMFIALILLSILVLILTGYKLRKKFKDTSSNIILIFSICYALVLTIVSAFSVIYISSGMPLLQISSYLSNIYMGAGVISTFIISFIYSYIISKIGYTLSDFE